MKKLLILLLLLVWFPLSVKAAENNKFGIHLAVPASEQIEKAAELVNSTGGDWGYITLVIQENDRDHDKWQSTFDRLRQLHLIPIIRLATQQQGAQWRRPTKEDADQWVQFLDGLNWVVKDRYIVLFNEPNHGAEWGGAVDPVNYAQVAETFAQKLKDKNRDYYLMLAGFDASAPDVAPSYADEADFLQTVINTITVKTFNSLFSGLSSHSYPNPGFVGLAYGQGRGTIQTYDWEINLLKSWGVKDLPVFITETGWDGNALPRATVASNFEIAFNNTWLPDDRVKAVTPFVLDYQGAPFLGFSWRQLGTDYYYQQFYTIQGMQKTAGNPDIIQKGSIAFDLPKLFVVNSNYNFKVVLKNQGQGDWNDAGGYKIILENIDSPYFFSDIGDTMPNESSEVDLYIKTGSVPGKKTSKIALYRGDKKILESAPWNYEIVPLPSLNFHVSVFPRLKQKGNDFELQIFDEKEELVFKKNNVEVEHASGSINGIRNIALDRKYRVVILKPYYLPRQTFVKFTQGKNQITFKQMLPLDFNKDGTFDLTDIWTLCTHPGLISLILP